MITLKIFIAGGHGMVGSAIIRNIKKLDQKSKFSRSLILSPKRSELDLTNYVSVKNWFKENKPNVVIIAVAKVGVLMQITQCHLISSLKILKSN